MRILFLAHRPPYPPHKGEKIRALNILRHLARGHEVHLACPVDDGRDMVELHKLDEFVRSIVTERIHPVLRRALAPAAILASRSISTAYFYSRRLQRRIDDLIETTGIEAVFCSSSPMAEYVFRSRHAERLGAAARIMDLIDVDSAKWRQYASTSSPWTAWIYRHEARHLGDFERRIGRAFDRILVVSDQEREYLPRGEEFSRVSTLSNGVDLQYFSPDYAARRMLAGPALVFTGVMDYRPNVDGVTWFAEQVFPTVQSAVPDVRLYVVGDRPTRAIRALGRREGVVVTGFVEDVRDYLAGPTVAIAPLRIARGIQNKVLEAMAMGRPVIATQQAFEGIVAVPGRDLIVADGASAFAASAVALLRDARKASEIGRNARSCVEERYSWTARLRELDALLPTASGTGIGPSHAPTAGQTRGRRLRLR